MKYKYKIYNIVERALMEKGIKCAEFQYNKINLPQTNFRNLFSKTLKICKTIIFYK